MNIWCQKEGVAISSDLEEPWGLGQKTFEIICSLLREMDARSFVEFGSGASTLAFAQAIKNLTIISIEHDEQYFARTKAKLGRRAVKHVNLQLSPLTWQYSHHGLYYSYLPTRFPACVDAVLIDGPPGGYPLAREACLHQIFRRIRIGGLIFLDDCDRRQEKEILLHWQEDYGDSIEVTLMMGTRPFAVLRKTGAADTGHRFRSWCRTWKNAPRLLREISRGPS